MVVDPVTKYYSLIGGAARALGEMERLGSRRMALEVKLREAEKRVFGWAQKTSKAAHEAELARMREELADLRVRESMAAATYSTEASFEQSLKDELTKRGLL